MAMDGWFEELKQYVRFGQDDEEALRSLGPHLAPDFTTIADAFYARIQEHEGANAVLRDGETEVGRLKVTLIRWMERLLSGPWDDSYYQLRCRIGRVHVRIALPQHYMFAAMCVLRQELTQRIQQLYAQRPDQANVALGALQRILDIELAIMLHTYRQDMEAQQARIERLSTFGQLVGSIGHELRNPLGVMESSLYIIKNRAQSDERVKKHADRISEQIGLANNIISTLLDMIRDRPLVREPVDLHRVLQTASSMLTIPPGVCLKREIPEDLPTLQGDPTQLAQALRNLLENAISAVGPSGEILVRASCDEGFFKIVVADSGPGVEASIRKRLFEPLISAKPGGIGLGLSLVRRIVERHGGSVSYVPNSVPGLTSSFVLKLPRQDPASVEPRND